MIFSRNISPRRNNRTLTFGLGIIVGYSYFSTMKIIFESPKSRSEMKEARIQGPLEADDPVVIDLLKKNYMLPPSSLSYNLSTDPHYKKKTSTDYSWNFIHGILRTLFDQEYSKFFVEAGGYDGEYLSNTLWLEQHQNWTGLLIEPQPQSFQKMIYKRRKCWISRACLSLRSYPRSSVMLYMETRGNQKSNLDPDMIHGSAHEMARGNNPDLLSSLKNSLKWTNVTSQCFPFYSFVVALNQLTIDFLSLDLEGSEVNVLTTIPWNKVYIRTIVVENYGKNFDYTLVKWMNQKGFKILSAGGSPDYFFVNAEETKLIEKYRKKHQYFQEYVDKNIEIDIVFGSK